MNISNVGYNPSAWLNDYKSNKADSSAKAESTKTQQSATTQSTSATESYVPSQGGTMDTADWLTARSATTTAYTPDPTDPTLPGSYVPDAWLTDYRNGLVDESGEVDASLGDPTDYTNTATYDPNAWLDAYKANKAAIEAAAQEEAEGTTGTEGTDETQGTPASEFATTGEYRDYLTENYAAITNSNIEISDTVLQQAMDDPSKEKVLLDYLEGMDGAKDRMAELVASKSDDTHTMTLEEFSITLDKISDDNSGIEGTNYNSINVEGPGMTEEEYDPASPPDALKSLMDTLSAAQEESDEKMKIMLEKREAAAKEEAKAEAKREEAAEEEQKAEEAKQEEDAPVSTFQTQA